METGNPSGNGETLTFRIGHQFGREKGEETREKGEDNGERGMRERGFHYEHVREEGSVAVAFMKEKKKRKKKRRRRRRRGRRMLWNGNAMEWLAVLFTCWPSFGRPPLTRYARFVPLGLPLFPTEFP